MPMNIYVFKAHLWWEAPVDTRTRLDSVPWWVSGGVRGIGVWLRGMRIPFQLALWLKMSLSLSLALEHEYTTHIYCKGEGAEF